MADCYSWQNNRFGFCYNQNSQIYVIAVILISFIKEIT